jgi:hypothetical protein
LKDPEFEEHLTRALHEAPVGKFLTTLSSHH